MLETASTFLRASWHACRSANKVAPETKPELMGVAEPLAGCGCALEKLNVHVGDTACVLGAILEYDNGAHGAYWFTQVACGCPNEIDLRIMGTEGCLEWHQTRPDEVIYIKKGEAPRTLNRAGDGIDVPAGKLARVPFGQ